MAAHLNMPPPSHTCTTTTAPSSKLPGVPTAAALISVLPDTNAVTKEKRKDSQEQNASRPPTALMVWAVLERARLRLALAACWA